MSTLETRWSDLFPPFVWVLGYTPLAGRINISVAHLHLGPTGQLPSHPAELIHCLESVVSGQLHLGKAS